MDSGSGSGIFLLFGSVNGTTYHMILNPITGPQVVPSYLYEA